MTSTGFKMSVFCCVAPLLVLFFSTPTHSLAFTSFPTKRSVMTMRKGRKSLRKTVGGGGGIGGDKQEAMSSPASKTNWIPVAGVKSLSDLPREEGTVQLVDTMAKQLKDVRTNPTGAVGIVNYDGRTYCVAAACSSCKIPLSKAKILPPNEETNRQHPRVECDFCGSTYNARTGELVSDGTADRGLLGGVVKTVFASKGKEALPTYDLGEKSGSVLINLP